ncbi:MAG TPA: GNAT family N-acetyltransferase [Methylomirabilota bacterium]|nr:GNAT family N-acetyltransferase [Methylomirabilota bacterium]
MISPRAPAPDPAPYRVRLFETVADLPAADWARGREVAGTVFMDPRFLAAVEQAFRGQARVLHAMVYGRAGRPQSWASLCSFPVDVTTLAGPGVHTVVRALRRALPRLGMLRTFFVGLPVSVGQSHLAIAPDADPAGVLDALAEAVEEVAARERAWLVVWKEFDPAAAARLEPFLLARGYRRAESPVMHELDARFPDFDGYRAALTSHYRNDVRRSERKFRAAGLRVVHRRDAEEIRRLYTADVHRLYEAVVARATVKLETLPIEFFHELTRRLPGLVSLTTIEDRGRIVAFIWGMMDGRVHHFLFCGIDYTAARDADLYFNLMYHQLDDALRCGPARIEVGQTADTFKARLGCRPTPRYFFVKGSRPAARAALARGFRLAFPDRPAVPTYAVFRR